ncbi:MAG: transketolase family protein [Christensenellales bacterium]|jgi:transketolase
MGISTREAYGKALVELGKKYDFFVMDADLSKATQTIQFKKVFPHRFFNMGVSEGDMMTTAAGMASCGKIVFASSFAMFAAGRAYEQIRNSIAYPDLHVIVGGTHAGVLIGEDGASHQCIEDISLMRTIPNMTVLVPCDEKSVFATVETAITSNGPVYIRMGRGAAEDVYTNPPEVKIGNGIVLRDGSDATLIAIGDLVPEALKAAELMSQNGISAAVIDMISVKPLDEELVRYYAKKTGKIITAEDHNIIGGLGSAVSEVVAELGYAQIRRVGIHDKFGRSGGRSALQTHFRLNAQEILDTYKLFYK